MRSAKQCWHIRSGKGEGDAADNIVGGPEHSTLSNDASPRFSVRTKLFGPDLSPDPVTRGERTLIIKVTLGMVHRRRICDMSGSKISGAP
jgi:hypothetical protein